MTGKKTFFLLSMTLVAGFFFFGLPVDNSIDLDMPSLLTPVTGISTVELRIPGWLTQKEAIATPYRRSVRRTSRRTARRVSTRHAVARGGYYGAPRYYGGAAIATGIAVGVIVSSLPPACNTIYVNGIAYQNCSGTYYAPSGSQWIVVDPPR